MAGNSVVRAPTCAAPGEESDPAGDARGAARRAVARQSSSNTKRATDGSWSLAWSENSAFTWTTS